MSMQSQNLIEWAARASSSSPHSSPVLNAASYSIDRVHRKPQENGIVFVSTKCHVHQQTLVGNASDLSMYDNDDPAEGLGIEWVYDSETETETKTKPNNKSRLDMPYTMLGAEETGVLDGKDDLHHGEGQWEPDGGSRNTKKARTGE